MLGEDCFVYVLRYTPLVFQVFGGFFFKVYVLITCTCSYMYFGYCL